MPGTSWCALLLMLDVILSLLGPQLVLVGQREDKLPSDSLKTKCAGRDRPAAEGRHEPPHTTAVGCTTSERICPAEVHASLLLSIASTTLIHTVDLLNNLCD
jgi:hypothetical protein